jgi:hypothetical protein
MVLSFAFMAAGCFGDISGTVAIDGLRAEGVTVVLHGQSGDAYMTQVTDRTGAFLFKNVRGGSYKVIMDPPPGYVRSVGRKVVKRDFSNVTGVDFSIETATERRTQSGKVVGCSRPNGAHVWKGIPFAAPPVGELRWKAPRHAESWGEDSWLALELGPYCTQIADPLVFDLPEELYGTPVGSEDCLFLNIWAPPIPRRACRQRAIACP